mmetsp:Transcript_13358/g.47906  ORF Transcript_13358/g.47906 Transcript_13358/m.47906 type:complete len:299 (-) Transcript_13358:2752-3648(-)
MNAFAALTARMSNRAAPGTSRSAAPSAHPYVVLDAPTRSGATDASKPPPPSPNGRAHLTSMTPRARSISAPGSGVATASPGKRRAITDGARLTSFDAIAFGDTRAACVGSRRGSWRINSAGVRTIGSGGSSRSLRCAREIPARSSSASTAVRRPLWTYPRADRSATASNRRAVSSDFTAVASSGSFILAARRYARAAFRASRLSPWTRFAAIALGSRVDASPSAYSKVGSYRPLWVSSSVAASLSSVSRRRSDGGGAASLEARESFESLRFNESDVARPPPPAVLWSRPCTLSCPKMA